MKLESEWLTTRGSNPEPFIIYDNGQDAADRIVVFATETGLRQLVRSPRWFIDGNFKLAPNIFSQFYIVRTPLGDSAVTCLYTLLSGKMQAIYEEMFRRIERKCQEFGFNLDRQRSSPTASWLVTLITFMIAYCNDIGKYILIS